MRSGDTIQTNAMTTPVCPVAPLLAVPPPADQLYARAAIATSASAVPRMKNPPAHTPQDASSATDRNLGNRGCSAHGGAAASAAFPAHLFPPASAMEHDALQAVPADKLLPLAPLAQQTAAIQPSVQNRQGWAHKPSCAAVHGRMPNSCARLYQDDSTWAVCCSLLMRFHSPLSAGLPWIPKTLNRLVYRRSQSCVESRPCCL